MEIRLDCVGREKKDVYISKKTTCKEESGDRESGKEGGKKKKNKACIRG